jgi:hypothetical protein
MKKTAMKASLGRPTRSALLFLLLATFPGPLGAAVVSESVAQTLSQLLLGKEVKARVELPATKDGVNVFLVPAKGKRTDERGLDLAEMSKWLKARGVGVEANESATITDVRIEKNRVEVHLGGGGQGRRGGKHAADVSPDYKRAGGSRVNFRYPAEIKDADLQPEIFLKFMERVLDVSEIRMTMSKKELPAELKTAIDAKTVKEGMTYQMVLMSFGDPEQKKFDDSKDGAFSETWYYMKEGHRWVVTFVNGKVATVQVF